MLTRFLRSGNVWVVLGAMVVVGAWGGLAWAWATGVLTFENVLAVPAAILVFFLVMVVVLLGVYSLWDAIIKPIIAAIMRPRRPAKKAGERMPQMNAHPRT